MFIQLIAYGPVYTTGVPVNPQNIQSIICFHLTEKQRGWWRISDPEQMKTVHKNLHQRGMRERCLHDTISRSIDYVTASCTKNKKGIV